VLFESARVLPVVAAAVVAAALAPAVAEARADAGAPPSARHVFPAPELEWGVRYPVSLEQCEFKIFRVWIEEHDNDSPEWPDHYSVRGNVYYEEMGFKFYELEEPERDEAGHVFPNAPHLFLASPDGPKFTTGDGEGVYYYDYALTVSVFGIDPTRGGAPVDENRNTQTGMYEAMLMHPEAVWSPWPHYCDIWPPRARRPVTFSFMFSPGCTVCGTPRGETLRARQRRWDIVLGYGGDDRILGSPGTDLLYGYRGNDELIGGRGEDWLHGQDGNDIIRSRDGRRDRVTCGPGRDVVIGDRRDRISHDCERVQRG
jgi:hypothetical protein